MKYAITMLAASAIAVNAQYTISGQTITCTEDPNGNYCASSSLGSPIIIRCTDGVGEAANCSDNLSGEPPADVFFGECYESATGAGDASCSKNCVVYPDGGSPFTLPAALCTPKPESTSSSSQATTTLHSTTTSTAVVTLTGSTTTTSTGTSIYTTAGTTVTETFTTTFCPESTLSTSVLSVRPIASGTGYISHPSNGTSGLGSGSGSGSVPAPKPIGTGTGSSPTGSSSGSGSSDSSNGTVASSAAGGNGGAVSSPTATPVGPTTAAPSTFTGGAITNSASFALAAVGLFVAYFL